MNTANPPLPTTEEGQSLNPNLYTFQLAHDQGYRPQLSVTWEEDVSAWQRRFVSITDDEDTIDYLFDTQEEAEDLLLEYLKNPEIEEDNDEVVPVGSFYDEDE